VKVACQQACPTSAIVFGNVNDKKSAISEVRNGKSRDLVYHALDQLHALPSVSYLAKIRNTDRHVGVAGEEHAATGGEIMTGVKNEGAEPVKKEATH
jgi:molybdopterin-containing oxidoreductase family iron-sulfur binding subunit